MLVYGHMSKINDASKSASPEQTQGRTPRKNTGYVCSMQPIVKSRELSNHQKQLIYTHTTTFSTYMFLSHHIPISSTRISLTLSDISFTSSASVSRRTCTLIIIHHVYTLYSLSAVYTWQWESEKVLKVCMLARLPCYLISMGLFSLPQKFDLNDDHVFCDVFAPQENDHLTSHFLIKSLLARPRQQIIRIYWE